jgi:serine phosphatase RsbU (regulator of sigma subunit)/CHASE2 domain-containing sensor protein
VSDPAEAESESTGSRRIWIVGLLALALLTALIGMEPVWNNRLQSFWFDSFQRLHSRPVVSTPAMVVEIDQKSIDLLGQWPWPRTMLAKLIRDIERYQPAAIGIDIWMPEADRLSPQQLLASARQKDPVLAERLAALPSNDAELAAAIGGGPVVLGMIASPVATGKTLRAPPFMIAAAKTHASTEASLLDIGHVKDVLPNIDELEQAASGHGLLSAGDPEKGVIRRLPLVTDVHNTLTPALSIEMLRVALHAPAMRLHVDGSAVQAVSIGNLTVPTDADGALRIYYSERDPRRYVSASDVLAGKVDPLDLRNKLVLVAMTGLAATDYQNTPLGVPMPGSEIHAQLLENVFDQTWLKRPPWAPALELAVFVLLGLLLIWATPRWKPRNAALLATACVVLPALAAFMLFNSRRQLYDAATTGLGLLILFSVLLVLTLADATRRRKSLELVVQAQRVQAAYVSGELEAAQRIQTGILPRVESLRDERRIDLAASMIPAREVGGDLYDFFRLDADRLFFLIGDVAGKGLSASIFMAISKSLYKSATLRRPDATISELMRNANEEVSRDNPEMYFVTIFAGIINLASGELTYCNAGHDNPYVLAEQRPALTRLEQGAGPPLCTVDGFAYTTGRYAMRPGKLLCLVTDGVADAQNPAGERYGSERLQHLLARLAKGSIAARAVVDAVDADVKSFVGTADPADDVTVLALRWLGPGATV